MSAVLRTTSHDIELRMCLDSECDVLRLARPKGTQDFSISKTHGKRFAVEGKWSPYAVDLRIRFGPIGRTDHWKKDSVLSAAILEPSSGRPLLDVRRRVCWEDFYPNGPACDKRPCLVWRADLSPE